MATVPLRGKSRQMNVEYTNMLLKNELKNKISKEVNTHDPLKTVFPHTQVPVQIKPLLVYLSGADPSKSLDINRGMVSNTLHKLKRSIH